MIKISDHDRILLRMPSLKALKAFVAAAKYQNFTRAAESLCVTQAAISRQIRELEEILDIALFVRKGRGIELTSAGHTLFDAVYLSFLNISEATERIRGNQRRQRELRVCASPAFSSLWLAQRLPDFFDKHENAELNVQTTEDFDAIESSDRPDIVISMNPAGKDDYKSIRLFSERIYPVCTPEFKERNPNITGIEDLKSSTLLELSPFRLSQIYEHFDWSFWFYLAGSPSTTSTQAWRSHCQANDYNIVLQMTLAHKGIALGWDHLVSPLVASGRLIKAIDTEVVLKEKPHYFFYDAGIVDSYDFNIFKNWFLSYFDSNDISSISKSE